VATSPGAKRLHGSATLIAREIRQRIESEVGITASAGIAPNKFLAKVGSDWNKPNGQFVLTPADVAEFVALLPVRKIFGVGKVTAAKLKDFGVETCGDLQAFSAQDLTDRFGKFGVRLYELARGEDDRPVKTSRQRKSMSVEHTYPRDLNDLAECQSALPALLQRLQQRLEKLPEETRQGKPVLKMKFNDFTQTTVEHAGADVNLANFEQLCEQAFERGQKPVRLLGLGLRLAAERLQKGEGGKESAPSTGLVKLAGFKSQNDRHEQQLPLFSAELLAGLHQQDSKE
jgi:DNA polymerase-4